MKKLLFLLFICSSVLAQAQPLPAVAGGSGSTNAMTGDLGITGSYYGNGSHLTGVSGSQTPWLSDINGNNTNSLTNVFLIRSATLIGGGILDSNLTVNRVVITDNGNPTSLLSAGDSLGQPINSAGTVATAFNLAGIITNGNNFQVQLGHASWYFGGSVLFTNFGMDLQMPNSSGILGYAGASETGSGIQIKGTNGSGVKTTILDANMNGIIASNNLSVDAAHQFTGNGAGLTNLPLTALQFQTNGAFIPQNNEIDFTSPGSTSISLLGQSNTVWLREIEIAVGTVVSNAAFKVGTWNGQRMGLGLYSYAGTKLLDTGAMIPSITGDNMVTLSNASPVSPGFYWMAWAINLTNAVANFRCMPVSQTVVSFIAQGQPIWATANNVAVNGQLPATLGGVVSNTPSQWPLFIFKN